MALFIEVREYFEEEGMKRRIFLTNKYTRKELSEKLQPLVDEKYCSQEYVDAILKEGQVLEEDCTFQLKGEAILETQLQGATWYYYPKDEIIIHPNGTWSYEKYFPLPQKILMFLYDQKRKIAEFFSKKCRKKS